MRTLVLMLCLVGIVATSSDNARGQSADASADYEVTDSANALQLLWTAGTATPADLSPTLGLPWQLLSARFVQNGDDFYFFAEARNISASAQPAPRLSVELLTGDDSFGVEEITSENEWVESGESAFFQALQFFGASLDVGDWDDQVLVFSPNEYNDPDSEAYAAVRVDGDRIFNDGETPIGEVYFSEVVRDAEGIFTAACIGPSTGALIPPDNSVRAPGLTDLGSPGGCGFSSAGIDAATELGYGDDFTSEYVLSVINE